MKYIKPVAVRTPTAVALPFAMHREASFREL